MNVTHTYKHCTLCTFLMNPTMWICVLAEVKIKPVCISESVTQFRWKISQRNHKMFFFFFRERERGKWTNRHLVIRGADEAGTHMLPKGCSWNSLRAQGHTHKHTHKHIHTGMHTCTHTLSLTQSVQTSGVRILSVFTSVWWWFFCS